jgi:hypothetical protein
LKSSRRNIGVPSELVPGEVLRLSLDIPRDPHREHTQIVAMLYEQRIIVYNQHMPASACQLFPDAFALISHPEKSSAKAPFRQVNESVSPLQSLINMRKKTGWDALGAPRAAAVPGVRAR